MIRAPSSKFVSSSIPSWQTLTAHAQPFRGARDLAFCLKVPLDSLLVWASSEGSGETAHLRRLARTFAARIGDKYQIRLTRSIIFRIKVFIRKMFFSGRNTGTFSLGLKLILDILTLDSFIQSFLKLSLIANHYFKDIVIKDLLIKISKGTYTASHIMRKPVFRFVWPSKIQTGLLI